MDTLFVVAETCGRFDQIMGNINTLHKASNFAPEMRIYHLSSDCATWLLGEGSHVINVPVCVRENNEWCALIPIGSPCRATTTGLKWNLSKFFVVSEIQYFSYNHTDKKLLLIKCFLFYKKNLMAVVIYALLNFFMCKRNRFIFWHWSLVF